jgi:hypothetical protein
MDIINLTPHSLNLVSPNGETTTIQPSGQVARVASQSGQEIFLGPGLSCLVFSAPTWGEVEGLPGPQADTIYIVSGLVAGRLNGRPDVFSPGTGPKDGAVRDEQGRITGVTRLIQSPQ